MNFFAVIVSPKSKHLKGQLWPRVSDEKWALSHAVSWRSVGSPREHFLIYTKGGPNFLPWNASWPDNPRSAARRAAQDLVIFKKWLLAGFFYLAYLGLEWLVLLSSTCLPTRRPLGEVGRQRVLLSLLIFSLGPCWTRVLLLCTFTFTSLTAEITSHCQHFC